MIPNSLLVGLTFAVDCLSLDGPVDHADTVEVDTLDLPPAGCLPGRTLAYRA